MISKSKIEGYKKRAKELVEQMTLEEKVYQLRHPAPAIPRLGIKAYNYWNEALHGVARAGVATLFPQAIGLAASFDEELIADVAEVVSTEGRAMYNMHDRLGDTDIYKGLTFWAPNVNIFRDPRWGRGHETYGEDPYLTSRLGYRFVKGIQGDDENYLKAAACAKHFAVHSGPEAIRHSFDAKASVQDIRETYLPAFKTLVEDAGVEAVMGAYNRTNGEPCCGSKTLLKDILRDEWGFDGHVVSDCWAVKDFHENHCVTKTPAESSALAMNNGCDLNCGNIFQYLLQAVEQNLVEESRIDEALTRVLTTRMKLGLFDGPENNKYSGLDYSDVDTDESRAFNLEVSKRCITLLKNDGILPIRKESIKTVGIVGPNADNRRALVGNYEGTASEYVTILQGLRKELEGSGIRIHYSEGCHLYKDRVSALGIANDRSSEVKALCEASDVVFVCVGLDASLEGEEGDTGNEYGSGDKPNLNLPGIQQQMLEEAAAVGKPVVLIVLSGSALNLDWADKNVAAIIQGWYPGSQGGSAIAEMIFGKCCPEGKLPLTFYHEYNTLPEFTDYSMKGRTYRYMKEEPLYPFGFGLSYTSFEEKLSDISTDTIDAGEKVNFKVSVKNTGDFDGAATVQVYVKYLNEDAPNCQLKALKKVRLKKGESTSLDFSLDASAFALYDTEGKLMLNKGEYEVYVGDAQPDKRTEALRGMKCEMFRISVKETKAV